MTLPTVWRSDACIMLCPGISPRINKRGASGIRIDCIRGVLDHQRMYRPFVHRKTKL